MMLSVAWGLGFLLTGVWSLEGRLFLKDCGPSCGVTGCRQVSNGTKTALECATGCAKEPRCTGFHAESLPADTSLYNCDHFYQLGDPFQQPCDGSPIKIDMSYRTEHCMANGDWNGTECICHAGWVGQWCQRWPIDCSDASVEGLYPEAGTAKTVVTVMPLGAPQPFDVLCYLVWGGWTFIQGRQMSSCNANDFQRNWADYKAGFGDISCDFWLGNDKIHWLTSQRSYRLDITIYPEDWTLGVFQYEYAHFRVGDESTQYRLTIGYSFPPTKSAGDALTPHGDPAVSAADMPFSTYDRDNDMSATTNCAQDFKSGWWFNQCTASNINGLLVDTPDNVRDKTVASMMWKYDKDDLSLKGCEMKLVPLA